MPTSDPKADGHAAPALECFFDCSSPWTYLAFHNLRQLSAELGVAVHWRPILVGGIFNTINPSVYASRAHGVPAKQAHLRKDLTDWARFTGLDIRFPPSIFPINSVKAMRACCWLQSQGQMEDFALAVFQAYWRDDADIAQDAVLVDLARQVGVDPQALLAGIAQADIKAQLRANTDELIARGGFGSPSIFVGGDDLYFGNDRMVLVRAALQRLRA